MILNDGGSVFYLHKYVFIAEPDFPIGLRGLSLGPRGKGGPAVQPPPLGKKGREREEKGEKKRRKNKRKKERRKER